MHIRLKKKIFYCASVTCLLVFIAAVYFDIGCNVLPNTKSLWIGGNSFSMRPGFSASPRMVIFDANDHSGNLRFLKKRPKGWSVLVINIHTESQKKTCPDCIYVSSSIGESFHNFEGSSSWSKASKVKMATYLHLLSCPETDWIYVTERPYEIPYKALSRVVDTQIDTGPVFLGPGDVFEPCHNYVDPITWYGQNSSFGPPSQFIMKNITRRSIYTVVNECFYVGITEQEWKISLDQRAPILFVMPGTFAAFDFNNVLVPKEMMWTLIAAIHSLKTGNAPLVQQSLKLNLAVQRILWDTRHQIGFIPGPPKRKVCSFCSITSGIEALGNDQRRLMADWRCFDSHPIILCLEELIKTHVDNNHQIIIPTLEIWLHFLNQYPGKLTVRHPLSFKKLLEKTIGRRLFFAPSRLLRKESTNKEMLPYPVNPFQTTCQSNGKPYEAFIPSDYLTTDVLLLIIINDFLYVKNIPMLEYLYGRHFKHITYCSVSTGGFVAFYQNLYPHYPVSFITVHHTDHTIACTATAIKMNYDVIGYFQYSDDVLVNLWNYQNVPMKHPWFQIFKGVGPLTDEYFKPGNGQMSYFTTWRKAQSSMNVAWEHLQGLRKYPGNGRRIGLFLDTLANNTGCPTCIFFGNADIFYVPQSIAKGFSFFSDFFDSYDIHFEITLINVLGGLVPKDDIYGLSGKYAWGKDRLDYETFYKEDDHFFHPWKFSNLAISNGSKFFCQRYLHNIDQDLRKKYQKT